MSFDAGDSFVIRLKLSDLIVELDAEFQFHCWSVEYTAMRCQLDILNNQTNLRIYMIRRNLQDVRKSSYPPYPSDIKKKREKRNIIVSQ